MAPKPSIDDNQKTELCRHRYHPERCLYKGCGYRLAVENVKAKDEEIKGLRADLWTVSAARDLWRREYAELQREAEKLRAVIYAQSSKDDTLHRLRDTVRRLSKELLLGICNGGECPRCRKVVSRVYIDEKSVSDPNDARCPVACRDCIPGGPDAAF